MTSIRTFDVAAMPRKVVRQLPLLRWIVQSEFDVCSVLGTIAAQEVERVLDTSACCDGLLIIVNGVPSILVYSPALEQIQGDPILSRRIVLV